MNIFYIDADPVQAAQWAVDRHVVKMPLESAQMLSTAVRLCSPTPPPDLYKMTHKNHPCTVWARSSDGNYQWLYEHFIALLNEYTYRYGKIHATSRLIDTLKPIPENIPRLGFTTPPSCMPDHVKVSDDPIDNYRNCYRIEKSHIHSWKNRFRPEWIDEAVPILSRPG